MSRIAFIGLGTMGLHMANNLVAAGVDVMGYDSEHAAMAAFTAAGGAVADSLAQAVEGRDAVMTMLPAGPQVTDVHAGIAGAEPATDALLIDCSTIDVATTKRLAEEARARGQAFVDSPVSGGPEGARAGTLALMVGGDEHAVERARPLLEVVGAKLHHFGAAGSGQAAKACHNMIAGISTIAVCEGFALAQSLGLDAATFQEMCMGAAARSWLLENRCPVPGVDADAPSSNGYAPGFSSRLMAKDLALAQAAARDTGVETTLGAIAARQYEEHARGPGAELDMTAIYETIKR